MDVGGGMWRKMRQGDAREGERNGYGGLILQLHAPSKRAANIGT